MTREDHLALVARAALAPSVHNVQPARWRFDGGAVTLFEDRSRRLPAGDPTGRDAAMSLGAATEGLALALAERGARLVEEAAWVVADGAMTVRRRFAIAEGGAADPLSECVDARQSYRGRFKATTPEDVTAVCALATGDVSVIAEPAEIARVADVADRAGLGFFRDDRFRAELLSWMRLRRRDPRWPVDGLNAQAMAMSRVEALGAGAVMGPLFRPLDAVGLAGPLTVEAATIRSATAILLFHRPAGEDRFDSGRAFYRMWLRVTRAGLAGAVMASLADDPAAAAEVAAYVPAGRTLVSALRVGRAPADGAYPRARIAAADLLV